MSHWHFAKVIRNCTMLEKNIRTLRMNITFYNSSFMVFLSWKFVSCSGGQKYPLWYFGRDNECCGAPNCSLELRFAERQDLLTPWSSLFLVYRQEISYFFWNPKFCYCVLKNPPLIFLPSLVHPFHNIPSSFLKMHFNIIGPLYPCTHYC